MGTRYRCSPAVFFCLIYSFLQLPLDIIGHVFERKERGPRAANNNPVCTSIMWTTCAVAKDMLIGVALA
eukprot:160157-Prorocentrum_minimum.AAC.2